MTRLAIIVAGLVGLVAVAVAVVGSRSGERTSYRVAATFDTAKGIVAGQQVKVAGAVVGKVADVRLVSGPKARIVMDVDRRFEPFRQDATCRILSEGLISENYVECGPGTPGRVPLRRASDGVPTVAVARTAVPVSVQDVINVFSLPTDERLRVLITDLGLATAARGDDLNAILRRANPTLTDARRTLAILDGQRGRLTNAVEQTDRVLVRLAGRDRDVRRFVGRTADVAETTAEHRRALGETVRRLPPMLDAVRPGLRSLDRAATSATPLLRSLRRSAPGLETLARTLPGFTRPGGPAVRSLAAAAGRGRVAVRSTLPRVRELRSTATEIKPFARQLDRLLVSVRDQGGLEGTLKLLYSLATDSAAYDEVSHILSLYVGVYPKCFTSPTPPECIHGFRGPDRGQKPVNGSPAPERRVTSYDATGAAVGERSPGGGPKTPPPARGRDIDQARGLLDFLLR